MRIHDKRTIAELRDEFQKKFPYLKLEFYKNQHKDQEGSPSKGILDPMLRIGDIREKGKDGEVDLDGNLVVSAFEEKMRNEFELNIQVFRKSTHDVWLQTISTDHWTLAEQNRKGEEFLQGLIE